MDVLVAGGHGKIALRLLGLLADRGDRARGLIRKPGQAGDLERIGAEAVVADLERDDIAPHVAGAGAVVFAAGAGPGSGDERKRTVDLGGAVKLIEAARANGVARYVIVSSMGADDPAAAPTEMRPYLEAKAAADARVADSGLDYTIVRPGRLTDEPGSGRITIAERLGRRGQISRDDVAAALLATLGAPNTVGKTLELLAGDADVEQAIVAV